ncbi:DMT family transporter [Actinomycetospora sp. CA-053990]|uniref:DMT family transporter n=1 Tax=Actinomycetospora sp. CA-053990 TaxID=3239891 RepID=UPI003D90FDF9
MIPTIWWAAVVAVVAAALLGSASVAQQRATRAVPTYRAGDPRLVGALVRRPWWWAGTVASLGGLGLQVLALTLGPIIVVQSTMTSSIVSVTLAEWAILGRRPTARATAGMLLTTVGLVGVLLALSPTPGPVGAAPSTTATWVLGATCAATVVALTAWARRGRGAAASLAPALATGLGYGVTAIALKLVGTQLAGGWLEPLTHPALYVALVLGPFSILLSQNALQHGRVVTAVVSLILVVDPLVGLVAGILGFGEQVTVTAASIALAAGSGVVLLLGIGVIQGASARTIDPAVTQRPDRPDGRRATPPVLVGTRR